MVLFRRVPLADQEPSTSDSTVYKKDLPSKGFLSGLDVMFQCDTPSGAYGAESRSILDVINKIEVVLDGDVRAFSMTGPELWHHLCVKNGKQPWSNFVERPSDTAMIHMPLRFGRYLGDPNFGINLGNFQNAQLLIDYDFTAGAGASTSDLGFATTTTKISAMMHLSPPDKPAPFQAYIGTRQFFTRTTVANEIFDNKLPNKNPIIGAGLYHHRSGYSQNSTMSKVHFTLGDGSIRLYSGRWYDHVRVQAERMNSISLDLLALVNSGITLELLTNWITDLQIKPLANNAAPSSSEFYHIPSFAVAGGLLTWGVGHKLSTNSGATGQVNRDSLRANIPMDVLVRGFPDRYVYFPLGDQMTLQDILNPASYSSCQITSEEGSTGSATESLIVEELRAT